MIELSAGAGSSPAQVYPTACPCPSVTPRGDDGGAVGRRCPRPVRYTRTPPARRVRHGRPLADAAGWRGLSVHSYLIFFVPTGPRGFTNRGRRVGVGFSLASAAVKVPSRAVPSAWKYASTANSEDCPAINPPNLPNGLGPASRMRKL